MRYGNVKCLLCVLLVEGRASRSTPVRQLAPTDGSDNGLFSPASPIAITPRPNRRGKNIHASAPFSTPIRRQYALRTTDPSSQANVTLHRLLSLMASETHAVSLLPVPSTLISLFYRRTQLR